jgi:hypothetical protein
MWYLPKNKEVPDHKFGVPPVRWYANYRTLYYITNPDMPGQHSYVQMEEGPP